MSGRPHRPVPTKLRVAFGRRLRALREARGLSQERLGKGAKLTGKFIGELERGQKSPTLDSLARLAPVVGVKLEELVKGMGDHRRRR